MSYESTILARSPVLYAPFTELSGTTFSDLSGNAHHGHALAGDVTAAAIDGPIAGQKACLLNDPAVNLYGLPNAQIGFDGPTTIPSGSGYTGAPITIELWVQMQISGGTGGPALIVDLSDHSIPTGFNDPALTFEMLAPPLSNGVNEPFGLDQGDDNGRNNASANAPFNAHPLCWHHYAVSWDGTNVRFYLDGALFGTSAVSMAVVSFVPQQLTLDVAVGMRKYVAHFAIYPSALSGSAIAANYAAATPRGDYACFGLPATYEAIVAARHPLAYWPHTETSGSTFADASGNDHTATISGPAVVPGGASSFLTGEFGAQFTTSGDAFTAGGSFSNVLTAFTLEFWAQLVGAFTNSFDGWLSVVLKDPSGITTMATSISEGNTATEIEWFTATGALPHVDNYVTLAHLECWNHYVITWDSSGNVNSYINGALIDGRTTMGTPSISLDHMIWDDDSLHSKVENVAHLALYPTALTASEVLANYNAATPRQDGACFGPPRRPRRQAYIMS